MASITDGNFLVANQGLNPLVNFNFMLRVELAFDLPCKAIRAFTRDVEYDLIQEGGVNDYVHLRRKPASHPFTLEVERYVGVDYLDPLKLGTELLLPMLLFVSRKQNGFLTPFRTYVFTGCSVMKKEFGELNAEQSGLLVETTTIAYRELLVVDTPWNDLGGSHDGAPEPQAQARTADKNAPDLKAMAQSLYDRAKAAKELAATEYTKDAAEKLKNQLGDMVKTLNTAVTAGGTLVAAVDAATKALTAGDKTLEELVREAEAAAKEKKDDLEKKDAAFRVVDEERLVAVRAEGEAEEAARAAASELAALQDQKKSIDTEVGDLDERIAAETDREAGGKARADQAQEDLDALTKDPELGDDALKEKETAIEEAAKAAESAEGEIPGAQAEFEEKRAAQEEKEEAMKAAQKTFNERKEAQLDAEAAESEAGRAAENAEAAADRAEDEARRAVDRQAGAEERLAHAEQTESEAKAAAEEAGAKVPDAEAAAAAVTEAKAAVEEAKAAAETAAAAVEPAKAAADEARAAVGPAKAAAEEARTRTAEAQAAVDAAAAAVETAAGERAEAEELLNMARSEAEQKRNEETDLRTGLEQLKQRRQAREQDANRRLEDGKDTQARAKDAQTELKARLADLHSRGAALDAPIKAAAEAKAAAETAYGEAADKAEAAVQATEQPKADYEKALADYRSAADGAEAANVSYQQAQAALGKARIDLDDGQRILRGLQNSQLNMPARMTTAEKAQTDCAAHFTKCEQANTAIQAMEDEPLGALNTAYETVNKYAKDTMFQERQVRTVQQYLLSAQELLDSASELTGIPISEGTAAQEGGAE